MNQILNMVMRMFLRKVISRGMDKGMDMAMGPRKKGGHGVSDADRAEMEAAKKSQQRAKQAMRVGKRLGKF